MDIQGGFFNLHSVDRRMDGVVKMYIFFSNDEKTTLPNLHALYII